MSRELIEPKGAERRQAIRICRLNAWLHPDTGETMHSQELCRRWFDEEVRKLPASKWLWVWNNAREAWAERPANSSPAGQS